MYGLENQIAVFVEKETLAAFQLATEKVSLVAEGVRLKDQVPALVAASLGAKQLSSIVFDDVIGREEDRWKASNASALALMWLLGENDWDNISDGAQGVIASTMLAYKELVETHRALLQDTADLYGARLRGSDVTKALAEYYVLIREVRANL